MKKLLLLLALLPSLSFALPTQIIDGKLTWTAPTTYSDDSPIIETLTYGVYCNDGGPYIQSDMVEVSVNEQPLSGYPVGNHFCKVTAITSKGESAFSDSSVNFTCSGQCIYGVAPNAPTNLIVN